MIKHSAKVLVVVLAVISLGVGLWLWRTKALGPSVGTTETAQPVTPAAEPPVQPGKLKQPPIEGAEPSAPPVQPESSANPQEPLAERARRLCTECGLGVGEVDRLIGSVSRTGVKRKDAMGLFRMAFKEYGKPEVCEACSVAIIDAAKATPTQQHP